MIMVCTIFFVLVIVFVDYIFEVKRRKKQEFENREEERICAAIEAAILPFNMGKSINEVKENLSKAEIAIEFRIPDDN